jgi:hypothetical protein
VAGTVADDAPSPLCAAASAMPAAHNTCSMRDARPCCNVPRESCSTQKTRQQHSRSEAMRRHRLLVVVNQRRCVRRLRRTHHVTVCLNSRKKCVVVRLMVWHVCARKTDERPRLRHRRDAIASPRLFI